MVGAAWGSTRPSSQPQDERKRRCSGLGLRLLFLQRRLDEAGFDDLLGLLDDVADDLGGGLDLTDEAGGLARREEGAGGVEGVTDAHVVHDAVLDRDAGLHREGLDLVGLLLPLVGVLVADGAGRLAGVAAGADGVGLGGADDGVAVAGGGLGFG